MSVSVRQFADQEEIGPRLASDIIEIIRERQLEGSITTIVLTGGSMGEASLRALGSHPDRESVDWRRVRLLWGDERWVPAGHEDRNDKLADDLLLHALDHDPALIHRVAASDSGLTLEQAAEEYARLIDEVGAIDVALNGVGPDGHFVSLFPGRDELNVLGENAPSALAIRNSPKPPPERVTFSLPAMNRAERVWLLAAGASKAEAVAAILHPGEDPLPAARVRGARETVLWTDDAGLSLSRAS